MTQDKRIAALEARLAAATAVVALLVAVPLQVASAHTPLAQQLKQLAQQLKQEAMLDVAYNDCVSAAANFGRGILSVHRADWPNGYRDCAIIMRWEYRIGHEKDIKAWEHWYAKHAAQRVQIRKAAAMLRGLHGVKQ